MTHNNSSSPCPLTESLSLLSPAQQALIVSKQTEPTTLTPYPNKSSRLLSLFQSQLFRQSIFIFEDNFSHKSSKPIISSKYSFKLFFQQTQKTRHAVPPSKQPPPNKIVTTWGNFSCLNFWRPLSKFTHFHLFVYNISTQTPEANLKNLET